jgi:hypothetical protein
MSQQPTPLTAEIIFEMFRETREQMKETDRIVRETTAQMKETDRRLQQMRQEVAEQQKKTEQAIERTHKEVGSLGSRIGDIIEHMVGGDIVKQFQALNIAIKSHSRDKTFGIKDTDESGQIDVFLENGDIVILIEVKTKLTDDDVREHIEQLENYRLYGDDKRRIIGAVAAGVVSDNVIKFAHRQGLYVIVQSGEAVEIVTPPVGFTAKEW